MNKFILFLLMLFIYPLTTHAVFGQPQDLVCGLVFHIDHIFLDKHIVYTKETANLEHRAIEQYIKRLDSTKRYFLQSDIDSIRQSLKGLTGKLKNQNCDPLFTVQKLYIKRLEERMNYVKKTLGKDFKFDPKTELVVDPEHRQFPKTAKELDREHDKFLQFQVSNYLASDMQMEEAKQTVIRSYERMVRRVSEMKEGDIYSAFIDSYSRSLDPHSSYFSHSSFQDFEIQMGLSLEGIGATLSSNDGFTVVEQLIPGGAAARSGQLKPKDKIIGVGQDGKSVENVIEMDLRDVVQRIRGKKGSKVRLTVLRKENNKQIRLNVTLVRDKIDLKDEEAAIINVEEAPPVQKQANNKEVEKPEEVKKSPKLAVLRLPSFYAEAKEKGRSSAHDMKKLLKEVREKSYDGLVLDLSDNAGGSLEDAVKIAGLFFKTGNVVKQSSRDSTSERALKDTDPEVDWAGPLVVLTNRLSASASEIVAGTLKDYNRAVIVGGDHTFGKGSVQSVIPLPPNLGAVKVTVGMFFIPGGKSTQHEGVSADITLPGAYAKDDVGEKSLDYSLPPKKLKSFKSDDAYVKDGVGAWQVVTADEIKALKGLSEKRVAIDKDFIQILKDLKEDKSQKVRTVKLSDSLKEKEKETKKEKELNLNKSEAEKTKDYLARADVKEALSILRDLISLRDSRRLAGPSSKTDKGS